MSEPLILMITVIKLMNAKISDIISSVLSAVLHFVRTADFNDNFDFTDEIVYTADFCDYSD